MIWGVGWDSTKQAKNEMAEFFLALNDEDVSFRLCFWFWSIIGF
jgi:hypothetical protein